MPGGMPGASPPMAAAAAARRGRQHHPFSGPGPSLPLLLLRLIIVKIKRRIRESYRINKHLIKKKGLKIGIIYSETKIMNFQEINKSLEYIIRKINSND